MFIVKGDRKSLTISTASLVAKVRRGRILCEISKEFPKYKFKKHKADRTKNIGRDFWKRYWAIKGS